MATMSPIKDFLLAHLMPEVCYNRFFIDFHFVHVPCLKVVLNRTVGYWILLDVVLSQFLQLMLILRRGSADGLSLTAALLQLYALSCPVVYFMANSFLILHYRGDNLKGLLLLLAYSALMFMLRSHATAGVISLMQASSLLALIASKFFQAGTNCLNGHTGQLSTPSVCLTWAGSLALIYASLLETGSSVATLSLIVSACLSCVLLAQVLCYRSNSATTREKRQ
ncbi:mannose-P-dolichol utilization defect 1 protein-like [Genypterus blacodes]|uniref:mannose-P-dolichol utilization defect 1 protein-like n=1 Tax=Genypterus blacodes TaxID=154954 RepID=UPI003F76BC9D